MKLKLGIIGSGSMVGSQVCTQFEVEKDIELIKGDLGGDNPIDITDNASTENFFKKNNFDWAILFSAYTDVSGAEKQRNDKNGICSKINIDGVKNVLAACKKFRRNLVFFSTDFVFDGSSGPYSEEDPTGPNLEKVSWYGITKIEGEKAIKNTLGKNNYIILRIAYPYSGVDTGKEDLVLRTLNYFKKMGKIYPMYDDQVITPTYILDIAPTLITLIKNEKRGIFHLASPKLTTQYEFAQKLLSRYLGRDAKLQRGKLKDALLQKDAIPRPLLGGLKTDKIQSLGINPTSWNTAIEKISTFV